MNGGDARDSVITLITCRISLTCSDPVSVTGNGIHSSNLSGLGRVASGLRCSVCCCVCNTALMLLYLVCKGKKKASSHVSQKRGRRFKVMLWCKAETEKSCCTQSCGCYRGGSVTGDFCKIWRARLEGIRWEQQLPVSDLGSCRLVAHGNTALPVFWCETSREMAVLGGLFAGLSSCSVLLLFEEEVFRSEVGRLLLERWEFCPIAVATAAEQFFIPHVYFTCLHFTPAFFCREGFPRRCSGVLCSSIAVS